MMERILRGIAGIVVLVSIGLAQLHSPNWLYVTGFMGLNLFQSAFTNWCPMMPILRAMGIDKKKRIVDL